MSVPIKVIDKTSKKSITGAKVYFQEYRSSNHIAKQANTLIV